MSQNFFIIKTKFYSRTGFVSLIVTPRRNFWPLTKKILFASLYAPRTKDPFEHLFATERSIAHDTEFSAYKFLIAVLKNPPQKTCAAHFIKSLSKKKSLKESQIDEHLKKLNVNELSEL